MENLLPENLTFPNSRLKIFYGENVRFNKTQNSIVIEGTREGFLSLSNAITYLINDLQDIIFVSLIPYVTSDVIFTIENSESVAGICYGKVKRKEDNIFEWVLSETEICNITSEIHSLGHINSELHFDQGKPFDEITVYCVVT